MKIRVTFIASAILGLLAAPAFAQTTTSHTPPGQSKSTPAHQASKQPTQSLGYGNDAVGIKHRTDGNSPTMVGPASGAYRQRTDGNSPTLTGPGNAAVQKQ